MRDEFLRFKLLRLLQQAGENGLPVRQLNEQVSQVRGKPLKISSTYNVLERLIKQELVTDAFIKRETQFGRGTQRVFRVTDLGRAAVNDLLNNLEGLK